jgi:hypothetical protein
MSAISLPQFRLVQKMLRSRVRHCEIARATGLSVWTISRIAGDLRRHGRHLAPRDESPHAEPTRDANAPEYPPDLPEDDAPPDYVATNLRRCAGCGGMVYQWPCRTCLLRSHGQPLRP